jgi:hypothetical protein
VIVGFVEKTGNCMARQLEDFSDATYGKRKVKNLLKKTVGK